MRGRLNGAQRNKLKGLLDMLYTPRELASELSVSTGQVYAVYIPFGCPHTKDRASHILINGVAFSKWYTSVYVKIRMGENQTFCRSCMAPVDIVSPVLRSKGLLVYLLSSCPRCGRKLTKIISYKGM